MESELDSKNYTINTGKIGEEWEKSDKFECWERSQWSHLNFAHNMQYDINRI